MAVKKDRSIDDFKTEPIGVRHLLDERKMRKDNMDFRTAQPVLFAWTCVFSVLLITLTYFLLPASRVKAISVSGNNYLPKDYVEHLSGITYKSRYFLTFPTITAHKIEEDPMISKARINLLPGNIIQIAIEENQPVAYRYNEDGPVFLMSDGSEVGMKREYTNIISRVPFVEGFYTEDQTHLLTKALSGVDRGMIEEIAEIRQYTLYYDDETLMIQMREGGYFFTNYFSIDILNRYHEYYAMQENKEYCFFADSTNKLVQSRPCPWNQVPEEHEYWLDEHGDYMLNKWGDRAVKHYYKDAEGNFYLDEEGNKIVIPIDQYVNDMPDEDFLDHYMKGYYKTGHLEIPEEVLKEEERKRREEAGEEVPDEENGDEPAGESGDEELPADDGGQPE